jgi:peroxiredoxin/tetratricopeptide (TPR) repeat protein
MDLKQRYATLRATDPMYDAPFSCLALIVLLLSGFAHLMQADEDPGHSRHGTAFDSGLRQRPWRMEGIGHTHFAITTKVPEVQEWFDQGNTLLHSFWFEEAERSFRWCLKLDPDCAMAYWSLARCGLNWFVGSRLDAPEIKRYLDFLDEAIRRKELVSARERMYIEAWENTFVGRAATSEVNKPRAVLAKELQKIVLQYPDDVEAKALFALFSIDSRNALGTELVLRQVFEKEPDHPGAHHYRIHTWDHVAPVEGLPSCIRYGPVAPNIGHANHMPGHNYSKMGLWREAARSMDAATRVELRYMNERLALPFETWNYAHNRNYLCYIQEQLGMAQAALQGARDLLAAPRDPELNKDNSYGAFDQGLSALIRTLVRFERWDNLLTRTNLDAIPWRDVPQDNNLRAFAETVALVGQGDLIKARSRLREFHNQLRQQSEKEKGAEIAWAIPIKAAEGLLHAAQGDLLEATRFLTDAAALEQKDRDAGNYVDDPPLMPWPIQRVLGDVYLQRNEYRLASEAYRKSLAQQTNDAFALCGLARAQVALGNRDEAQHCYSQMLYLWSGADAGLRWMTEAQALGLKPEPKGETVAPERPYGPDTLANLGPINWEPYPAPRLSCLDIDGKPITLEDFKGSNVLLIFYLNDECVHCMEQLTAVNTHESDWTTENTVVLAISSAPPAKNKQSAKLGKFSLRLLSDQNHENARRFASYDDFEEMELHSTILIDTKGRVHWKRTGGKPFADVDFLLKSVKQMNQSQPTPTTLSKVEPEQAGK